MARKASVQTHDFASSPTASKVFDIPSGHTIVEVRTINCTCATAAHRISVVVGTGGTPDSGATDNSTNMINSGLSTIRAAELLGRLGGPEATGKHGFATIYGMNEVCPVFCASSDMSSVNDATDTRTLLGLRMLAPAVRDQVFITSDLGSDIDSGDAYVISYKRPATIQSLTASASAELVFTDFTAKNASMLLVASTDLVLSGANGVGFQLSTDGGSTWSNTFRRGFRRHNNDNTDEAAITGISSANRTDNPIAFVLWGMGQATQFTNMPYGGAFTVGTSYTPAFQMVGTRLAATAEDALKVIPTAGTITSGTVYAVGFKA